MSLPKIKRTIFELELPSTGEKINYTPFSVKEEKILLVAQESKDIEQSILSVKQIVNNCLIDKSVDELSMFDLEYVLLLLRSKSVDNTVKFSIKDPETEESHELEFDLDTVKVTKDESHSKEIRLDDDYVLYMRYPTINEFLLMMENKTDPETNYKIMLNCMDKLVTEDEVYKLAELEKDEVEKFLDSLDASVVKKMEKFFTTMPKMRHEITYTNSLGNEKTFVIEGLETFFI